ncbi:MAG TPA: glycosyltransferase [Byssovorax sp.]|jgi:predicted SAM-dependent methyltransferase
MIAEAAAPHGRRRLHVGGRVRVAGWEVLDANDGVHVDHVGDAGNLSRFEDGTFSDLYASHVLEHFDYKETLGRTLFEWRRVLAPGGTLHLSVPDLTACCRLFLDPRLGTDERFSVMRILYGGHADQHDYHLVGFDEDMLGVWLNRTGFVDVRRVADLGIFKDTSQLVLGGVPISLNVVARASEASPTAVMTSRASHESPQRETPAASPSTAVESTPERIAEIASALAAEGRADEARAMYDAALQQVEPLLRGLGELLLSQGADRDTALALVGAATTVAPPARRLTRRWRPPGSSDGRLEGRRIVFAFHSNPLVVRPPTYSSRQVTVGPRVPTSARAGALESLRTRGGAYDLAHALAPLGNFEPELVFVLADATRANLPRNLGSVPGKKVLLLGDTHHLDRPLQALLAYAASERFDAVVSAHYRHHLHFFREAGIPNVAWLPLVDADEHAREFPGAPRAAEIVTSGQIGRYHPARTRLNAALERDGLPLRRVLAPADELARAYGGAIACLNQSLNGDMNLRVAEVLAAGGCLVMDRLAPQAGLELILEPGREVLLYDDERGAASLLADLLRRPDEATAVARRGWDRFRGELSAEAQADRLARFLDEGIVEAPFHLERELRCVPGSIADAPPLSDRVPLYEHVQELNRTEARVSVGFTHDADAASVLDLIDLQRTEVILEEGTTARRLRAIDRFHEVERQITVASPDEFRARAYDVLVPGRGGRPAELACRGTRTWIYPN